MDLCDRCLGRRITGAQGADVQRPAGAEYRGEHDLMEVAEADCKVCEGRFADADTWLATILEAVKPYQFETFQLGTIFPIACEAIEKGYKELNPEIGDSIRTETNRMLAPLVAEATGTQWLTDARPDVQINLDTRFWTVEVIPNSIYLLGRYTKHSRDVPQTHWPCKECNGPGCHKCDDKGWQYESSVEQVICDIVSPAFGGVSYSFHGAGREDIDALMLGTGRPFVVEVNHPRIRSLPADHLDVLVQAVNATTPESGVGLIGLEPADKDKVVEIKAGTYNKEYLARCVTEGDVTEEQVTAAAAKMTGAMLQQRTPERVSHRRADLVRERRIHHMIVESFDDSRHFAVRVLADSGAYIKEMVHGDEGRTTPCLADVLGVPCRVEFLDVMAILD